MELASKGDICGQSVIKLYAALAKLLGFQKRKTVVNRCSFQAFEVNCLVQSLAEIMTMSSTFSQQQ